MKKILATLLIALLIISNLSSYAETYDPMEQIDNNNYELKKLTFKSANEVVGIFTSKSSIESQAKLKKENEKNISEAINLVKQMQFDKKGCIGLEEAMLIELQTLKESGTYITNYSIAEPKAADLVTRGTTTPEYYGVYNGYTFKQYFTTYNDTYSRESYDVNKMNLWANKAINLALCFVNATITVPITVLSSATQSDILSYGSNHITAAASDDVTTKYILIQDKMMKVSTGGNFFTTILTEQAKVNTTSLTTYFNTPYKLPKIDIIANRKTVVTSNFNSTPAINMARGYVQYINTNAVISSKSLGRFVFGWK